MNFLLKCTNVWYTLSDFLLSDGKVITPDSLSWAVGG